MADIFEVSPHALAVPDIDSYVGLMHTLFTLEDLYGLHIDEIDGELCLRLDKAKGTTYLSMFDMFHAWQEQAEKLKSGEITQEEYDQIIADLQQERRPLFMNKIPNRQAICEVFDGQGKRG